MGKSLTASEHRELVEWAENFNGGENKTIFTMSASCIKGCFDYELKQYFRLCGLARSKSANPNLVALADKKIFKTRVAIEKKIAESIDLSPSPWDEKIETLCKGAFFGASKKQGVSLRMPLSSCQPTALCASGCYAHDVLDAAPNSVVRGAINGWIAKQFETGGAKQRRKILASLDSHVLKAIKNAESELQSLPKGFFRRPYIRFSHVGEIALFPEFANALAKQIRKISDSQVDCVIYTRLKKANLLDSNLWVVNFTLDPSSLDRKAWAPKSARIVFSAFGGILSQVAEINFLEHHRHYHSPRNQGQGKICPATLPSSTTRTCDACKCNKCFVKTEN